MSKFMLITLNFEGRDAPTEQLKTALDKALDWVTYAPNCFIVYTSSDVDRWFQRLRKVVHENDSILIMEVVLENRAGWLPKDVWAWMHKDRSS